MMVFKLLKLLSKIFQSRNFSAETQPILLISWENHTKKEEIPKVQNVFVKMVKMVIQHGRSHVAGHSREHHGTQVMLNLSRAKEGFENS